MVEEYSASLEQKLGDNSSVLIIDNENLELKTDNQTRIIRRIPNQDGTHTFWDTSLNRHLEEGLTNNIEDLYRTKVTHYHVRKDLGQYVEAIRDGKTLYFLDSSGNVYEKDINGELKSVDKAATLEDLEAVGLLLLSEETLEKAMLNFITTFNHQSKALIERLGSRTVVEKKKFLACLKPLQDLVEPYKKAKDKEIQTDSIEQQAIRHWYTAVKALYENKWKFIKVVASELGKVVQQLPFIPRSEGELIEILREQCGDWRKTEDLTGFYIEKVLDRKTEKQSLFARYIK